MIGLGFLYSLAGLIFLGWCLLTLGDRTHPKRWGNAGFWGLIALSFLAGDRLGDLGNGLLVLALAGIAGAGLIGPGNRVAHDDARVAASAARHGNRLFLPALIVPALALAGTFGFRRLEFGGVPLVDPRQATLVGLALGVIVALTVLMIWLRPPAAAAITSSRPLAEAIGWAIMLPQLLASLGAVFALAGVGDIVGGLAGAVIPAGSRLAAVLAFTLGMAGLTMLLGNAFAAFPILMAAIGLPMLVYRLGGDPVVVAALGMLSGFCGTLLTPMAANYNIVPVALLALDDRRAVIKAQVATALPLLAFNTLMIWAFAFR